MFHAVIAAYALLAVTAHKTAGPPRYQSATEIIKAEGQFAFTDGSSSYLFKKDGKFSLAPLSMSGRTITGAWRSDGNRFTVTGVWGWVNGLSAIGDIRQMTLEIQGPFTIDTGHPRFLWLDKTTKAYHCYYVMEELASIPKATSVDTKAPNPFSDIPKNDSAYECLRDLHDSGVIKYGPEGFSSKGGIATRYEFAVIALEILRLIKAAPNRAKPDPSDTSDLTADAANNIKAPNPLASLAILVEKVPDELTALGVDVPAARQKIQALLAKTGE